MILLSTLIGTLGCTHIEKEEIIGLEILGGIPTLTFESERIGIFLFVDSLTNAPLTNAKVKYTVTPEAIGERRIAGIYYPPKERHSITTTNEDGIAEIPIIWHTTSPFTFSETELPEYMTWFQGWEIPTGTVHLSLKGNWIECLFPHEDQPESTVQVEWIDWKEEDFF